MPDAGSSSAAGRDALADRQLLEPIARAALAEITPETTVGAFREITVEDAVATVRFSPRMGGYPGWVWAVAIAVNEGLEPSVLETELIPSDGALVAPDWVPWSDRLEEYLSHQADEDDSEEGVGDDDSEDDDHEHDEDDLDPDDDVDGVDIDEHAPESEASADDDSDDDSDDEDSDDDSAAHDPRTDRDAPED